MTGGDDRVRSPRIIGSAATLLVKDVVAAADYYRDRVGFSYEHFWGEPACFCILWRDGFHLMLSQVEDARLIVPRHRSADGLWDVYFWVDDVEALYRDLVGRGAYIEQPPGDQFYGCREFSIRDLDDHHVTFGQDMDSPVDDG